MPEYTYISHKVKKGETLWGIAKQYGVEEHKILQANPSVSITPKGKGKYDIANLKEGQVLKIPQKAKEKTMQKQGVKAITGNSKPSVGNAEIYEVTQWYEATPTSLRNPAKVKWIIHKQNPQGHYIPHENSQKTGKGEFTFNEQSLGQKIKITGYLFTPELNNDSSLDLKVQQAEKRSIIGVALKDINLNPLPKPYRLALGQTFFVTVRTTNSIGNRVVIRLMKKKDPASQAAYKQGNSEEGIEYELYQQQTKTIKENGQATAYFQLDDFQLLMNSQKIQKYNVLTYLEESTETVINVTPVDAENTPTKKPPEKTEKKKEKKKEEDTIIYQGVSLLTEGWNNLKETYKILTTSDDPQIERVKLEIPEGKTQITYEDSLTLKIEGRNLKDKTLEYTLYKDDVASKDELQKGTHTLKGDIDSIKIQLNKEMYLKGGTSWFETQDGKHEIFVEIKLKGTKISKSSGIIEVDISQHKPDIPQNESVVTEGVLDLSENSTDCVCKELIWGKKLTCEERKKVIQVCSHIWGDNQKMTKANMLMAVMHLETVGTFSPSKENGKGYVGLIQFHSSTAHSLGTTYEALKKMTFIQQMDFVEKYLKQNKDKMKTLVDFYLQVLKPNAVGQGSNPNYVVFDESISVPDGDGSSTSLEQRMKNISREPWVTKYGYSSNPPFMKEEGERSKRKKWVYTRQRYEERWGHHDGKTYIWEVEKEIKPKHYDTGIPEKYTGECVKTKKKEEKKEKGKRAPWMKIVLDETKNYGGYDEGTEPLKSRIKNTYFTIKNEFTTNKTDPTKVSWCATFVSWCLQQAEYSNPSSCRALEFNPEYMHDGAGKPDRPSGMRKISNPVYGCIIVWKNNSGGGGHVAFHYGYTLSGNIVPIGGNQGNSLKFSNRSPKGDYGQKIVGYFLPEDYEDNPEDEFTEDEKKLSPTSLNSSSLLKTSSIEDDKGKTT